MRLRPIITALAVSLAAIGAAAPPTTTEAVLAVDPCGVAADGDAPVPNQDVCSVVGRLVTGGTAPVLELDLELASDGTTAGRYRTAVTVGDCLVEFEFEDDVAGAAVIVAYDTDLRYGCGTFVDDCTFTFTWPPVGDASYDCGRRYDDAGEVTVAEPTVTGSTLTFRATLDGELAQVAARLVPGARIEHVRTTASLDAPFFTGNAPLQVQQCLGGSCATVGGDVVTGQQDAIVVPDHG